VIPVRRSLGEGVRTAWLILRKDLTVEVRSLEISYTTLFFGISCVLVFAFALVKEGKAPEDGAAGILWIAIAFAGTLALGRAFERERQSETLRALLMAQPRALGDARLAHAAERALGKLMASLPATMREQAASIRQRLHVDSAGWRGTSENLSMLPVVQDAVSRDRRLAITYWRRGGECVERTIDPLGLVAKGSAWYLVAWTADGFRTYRVSRIEQATLLELPCERPADFDLAAYWTESTARFDQEMPRFYARLRIEPQTARWLKMWRVGWSLEEEDPPPADGWVTLRMQFDRVEEACFIVLGLGPRVDVLEPDSLRARVADEAAAVIERTRAWGAAANTEGGTV